MTNGVHYVRSLLVLLLTFFAGAKLAAADPIAPINQTFSFQWTPAGQSPPLPVTRECDTLPITWQPTAGSENSPTAPFFLQVYDSRSLVVNVIPAGSGSSFDWMVPFPEGTLYQVCMFDANGMSGGCQDTYTVVSGSNTSGSCAQSWAPETSKLNVQHAASTNWSQYGWYDQCSDISITPANGTAPFTLTVAPSLHPPFNITSNDMGPINWTISMSWSSSFFISLVDATGLTWASGPLHSGKGDSSCLSQALAIPPLSPTAKKKVAVGAAVGVGILIIMILGAMGTLYWIYRVRHRSRISHHIHPYKVIADEENEPRSTAATRGRSSTPASMHTRDSSRSSSAFSRLTHAIPFLRSASMYDIEPFMLQPSESREHLDISRSTSPNHSTATLRRIPSQSSKLRELQLANRVSGAEASDDRSVETTRQVRGRVESDASDRTARGQVYVVHHDAGRAPVSVYTPEGVEVVELPPEYHSRSNTLNLEEATPRAIAFPIITSVTATFDNPISADITSPSQR